MSGEPPDSQDWLLEKGEVVERPFTSKVPLFGSLIAWFRTQWNDVATKWYVRPIVSQQNEFNRSLVQQLREFESYVYDISSEQDHDLSRLRHDVAAVQLQLGQLVRELQTLSERLEQVEIRDRPSGAEGEKRPVPK